MNIARYLLAGVVGAVLGAGLASLYYHSRTAALQRDLNKLRVELGDRGGQAEKARQENTTLVRQLDELRAGMDRLEQGGRAARERAERLIQELQEYRGRFHLMVVAGVEETPIQLSREQGEQDLMDLAITSDVEDMWVYYEEGGKGYWVNIGGGEKDGEVGPHVSPLQFKGKRNVTVYHMHTITGRLARLKRSYSRSRNVAEEVFLGQVVSSDGYVFDLVPSARDYSLHSRLRGLARQIGMQLQPSRVAGASRVFEYDLSPELQGEAEKRYGNAVSGAVATEDKLRRLNAAGLTVRVRKLRSLEDNVLLLERFKRFLGGR